MKEIAYRVIRHRFMYVCMYVFIYRTFIPTLFPKAPNCNIIYITLINNLWHIYKRNTIQQYKGLNYWLTQSHEWIQWCAGHWLFRVGKALICNVCQFPWYKYSHFNVRISTCNHWIQSSEEMHTIDPHTLVRAGSSAPLDKCYRHLWWAKEGHTQKSTEYMISFIWSSRKIV